MSSYFGQNGSFRRARPSEEADPMSSLGNMADVMLVFACGLMVALVVAWNVDLGKFTQVQMENEVSEDQITTMTDQLGEGNGFVEKGTVYQDPETGKYYLVEETGAQGGSSSNSQ